MATQLNLHRALRAALVLQNAISMCFHHQPHPVMFIEGVTLISVLVSAAAWKAIAPTPRPTLRAMASYTAALTALFAAVTAVALSPDGAGNYLLASLTGMLLAGLLMAEILVRDVPTAVVKAVELPRVRIVSSAVTGRGRDRISRAIARGRGGTPSPARR